MPKSTGYSPMPGVVFVEDLDLSAIEPGEYDFICLPIKLESADGATARSVHCAGNQ